MSETRPDGMCKDCRTARAAVKADGTIASRCKGCSAKAQKGGSMCAEHLAYYAEYRQSTRIGPIKGG
jgi:hypothetical protein